MREFCELETDSLAVFLIWNRRAERREVVCGIPDEQFCRGKVPMTKEEVRSISISKLRLWKDAVIYDVGAGTVGCCGNGVAGSRWCRFMPWKKRGGSSASGEKPSGIWL